MTENRVKPYMYTIHPDSKLDQYGESRPILENIGQYRKKKHWANTKKNGQYDS